MQFIDLKAQQQRIRSIIEAHIEAVLNHGHYIMGPEVQVLEDRLGTYVGVSHAISCSSGTDALLMALMAQDVGPGDAVITSPFTFIATAEVIRLIGATPVFADIDAVTFALDPDHLPRLLDALVHGSSRYPLPRPQEPSGLTPKGIIGVDLFGLPADYEALSRIAETNGLFLIEDAAQSFGSEAFGRKAGSLAPIACTSFFPAKPLGCYGDGGAVFTQDDLLAEKMRSIRNHGQGAHKYENLRIGINGRLDTLQAAILLAKLDIFDDELDKRREIADRYRNLLASIPDIVTPVIPAGYTCSWAQYSILAPDAVHRKKFMDRLASEGIPTAIYYPIPLHLQKAFSFLGYQPGDFPVAEAVAEKIFSLPMHPYLRYDSQKRIIDCLKME